jgi:hypothetical protein
MFARRSPLARRFPGASQRASPFAPDRPGEIAPLGGRRRPAGRRPGLARGGSAAAWRALGPPASNGCAGSTVKMPGRYSIYRDACRPPLAARKCVA